MKYVSFRLPDDDSDSGRFGLLDLQRDRLLDVGATASAVLGNAPPWSRHFLDYLGADADIQDSVDKYPARSDAVWINLDALKLLAPLPRPRSLRDCLSFEQHWIQCARTVASWKLPPLAWLDCRWQAWTGRSMLRPPKIWRERPIYYKGNADTVVGPMQNVQWPSYTEQLDFEFEIAVYIGKQGVDISPDEAMKHVAGYSLFNDFTARDIQFEEMRGRLGPSKSKDFDTGNAMGPFVASPDEVNLKQLRMQVRVNGEVWSEPSAAALHHSVADTIAFISRQETLYPGDVIGLGTAPNGCGLELNRWIQPGDEIELWTDGLGTLTNRAVGPRPPRD